MDGLIQLILDSIIFVLPLWFGNAAPTILGGGRPIDGGRNWRDGNRLLGDGKTIRGFYSGTLVGGLIGGIVGLLEPLLPILLLPSTTNVPSVELRLEYQNFLEEGIVFNILGFVNSEGILRYSLILGIMTGLFLACGGLIGDLIGSFIKRRFGIERGHTFIFLDQLGFLVLGMAFVYILIPWPIQWLLVQIPITFITHITANLFGYFTGIQEDPL